MNINLLIYAIQIGDVTVIKNQLKNIKDSEDQKILADFLSLWGGKSLLYFAIEALKTFKGTNKNETAEEIVSLLINAKANVNEDGIKINTENGLRSRSFLMKAAMDGSVYAMKLLIEKGANPWSESSYQWPSPGEENNYDERYARLTPIEVTYLRGDSEGFIALCLSNDHTLGAKFGDVSIRESLKMSIRLYKFVRNVSSHPGSILEDFSQQPIGNSGLGIIANALCKFPVNQITLNLSQTNVTEKHLNKLKQGLLLCDQIDNLDLSKNKICEQGIVEINSLIEKHKGIRKLNLAEINVGDVQGEELISILIKTRKENFQLDLSSCYLGSKTVTKCIEAADLGYPLDTLQLNGNKFSEKQGLALFRATNLQMVKTGSFFQGLEDCGISKNTVNVFKDLVKLKVSPSERQEKRELSLGHKLDNTGVLLTKKYAWKRLHVGNNERKDFFVKLNTENYYPIEIKPDIKMAFYFDKTVLPWKLIAKVSFENGHLVIVPHVENLEVTTTRKVLAKRIIVDQEENESSIHASNRRAREAHEILPKQCRLKISGMFDATEYMFLSCEETLLKPDARLNATNLQIRTDRFVNQGQVHTVNTHIECDQFDNLGRLKQDGLFEVKAKAYANKKYIESQNTVIKCDEFNGFQDAQFIAHGTADICAKNQYKSCEKVSAQDFYLITPQSEYGGVMNIGGEGVLWVDKKARFLNSAKVDVGHHISIRCSEDLDDKLHEIIIDEGAKLNAEEVIHLEAENIYSAGTFAGGTLFAEAGNVTLLGCVETENFLVQALGILANQGKVNTVNTHIECDQFENSGHLKQAGLFGVNANNYTNKGQIESQNTVIKCNEFNAIKSAEFITHGRADVYAENKYNNCERVSAQDFYLITAQAECDGVMNISGEGILWVDKKATFLNSADIDVGHRISIRGSENLEGKLPQIIFTDGARLNAKKVIHLDAENIFSAGKFAGGTLFVEAKNVTFSGQLETENLLVQALGVVEINCSEPVTLLRNAQIISNETKIKSFFEQIKDFHIISNKQITFDKTAQLQVIDGCFESKVVRVNGTIHASGKNAFFATNKVNISSSAIVSGNKGIEFTKIRVNNDDLFEANVEKGAKLISNSEINFLADKINFSGYSEGENSCLVLKATQIIFDGESHNDLLAIKSGWLTNSKSKPLPEKIELKKNSFFSGKYFMCVGEHITAYGTYAAKIELIWDATQKLIVGKSCVIQDTEKQTLRSKNLDFIGKILRGTHVEFIGGTLGLSRDSEINVSRELLLEGQLLKFHGNIHSQNIVKVIVNDVYFQKNANINALATVIDARAVFSEMSLVSTDCLVKVKEKLVITGADWTLDSGTFISNVVELRSKVCAKKNVVFSMEKTLSVYENGGFSGDGAINISGESVWTRGTIRSEKGDVRIAVDRYVVNGFVEIDTFSQAIAGVGSSIRGMNVDIVAAIILNLPACSIQSPQSVSMASCLNVNLGGFYLGWNISKNSIADVDCGINAPNPLDLYQAAKSVVTGDLSSLQKSLVGQDLPPLTENQTALEKVQAVQEAKAPIINLVIQALKFCLPKVGNVFSILYNLTCLAFRLPKILYQLKQLYDKYGEGTLRFRDVVPVIVGIKGVAMSASSIVSSSIAFQNKYLTNQTETADATKKADPASNPKETTPETKPAEKTGPQPAPSPAPSSDTKTPTGEKPAPEPAKKEDSAIYKVTKDVATTLASTLGPNYSSSSVFSATGPNLDAAWSVQRSCLAGYNSSASASVGFTVSKTFNVLSDHGYTAGHQVSMEGNTLIEGGKVSADQLYLSLAGELMQLSSSTINTGPDSYIEANKIVQRGQIAAQKTSIFVKEEHSIEGGQLLLSDHSVLKAGTVSQTGASKVSLKESVFVANKYSEDELAVLELISSSYGVDYSTIAGEFNAEKSDIQGTDFTTLGSSKSNLKNTMMILKDKLTFRGKTQLSEESAAQAKNISVSGEMRSNKGFLKATENVKLEKDSAIFGIETLFQGENVEVEGSVIAEAGGGIGFKAEKSVDLRSSANISGDGFVSATGKTGTLAGNVHSKEFHLGIEDFKDVNALAAGERQYANIRPEEMLSIETKQKVDITHAINRQSGLTIKGDSVNIQAAVTSAGVLNFVATQGDVDAHANLHGEKGLALKAEAGSVHLDRHLFTSSDTVIVDAKKSIENVGGKIAGREIFLETHEGDIVNRAGKIAASNYLQVVAGRDIVNTCEERTVQGAYGPRKEYDRGEMIGGAGEGHGGDDHGNVGALLQAEGKIINHASTLGATGELFANGKQGVVMTSAVDTYVSFQETKRGRFGKKKTVQEITTDVEQSAVISKNNHITSSEGSIRTEGAIFLAEEGNTISAKGKVELFDVIGRTERHERGRSIFGLGKSKHDEIHETSTSTLIRNTNPGGNVQIVSQEDSVFARSLSIKNVGGLTKILAKKDITLTQSILNHETRDKRSGWSGSVMGKTMFGDKDSSGSPFHNDPTLDHTQRLLKSHGAGELAANVANSAIDATNAISTLSEAAKNDTLVKALGDRFGLGAFTDPSASVTYTKSKSKSNYQTTGDGGIETGGLILGSGDTVTLEGVPVAVSNDMLVETQVFVQKGIELKQSSESSQYSITASTSYNAAGIDVGVAGSQTHTSGTQIRHQQLDVGGTLTVKANTWKLEDASVNTGRLEGEVKKTIIKTNTEKFSSETKSVSGSTTGAVSFQEVKKASETISECASIHVADAIDDKFHTADLEMIGGKVVTPGNASLNADHVSVTDVKTFDTTSSVSFSGNVTDLLTLGDDKSKSPISTANLSSSNSVTEGVQHAVVHGDQGTKIQGVIEGQLHTSDANGAEITKKKEHNYTVEVPMDLQLVQKFKDAWSAHDQKPQHLPQIEALQEKLGLATYEEAKEYVTRSGELSGLSYEDTFDEAKLREQGIEVLDNSYRDPSTGTAITIFKDMHTGTIFIAARGTSGINSVITDDRDIAFGSAPSGAINAEDYIRQKTKQYLSEGNKVLYTGHSRGAAQAAYFSSLTGSPAITLDNPGIENKGKKYDFSNTYSFQSTPNIVNRAGEHRLKKYDRGTVTNLLPTTKDQLLELGTKFVSKQMASSNWIDRLSFFAQTADSHNLNRIQERVEKTLEKGSEAKYPGLRL